MAWDLLSHYSVPISLMLPRVLFNPHPYFGKDSHTLICITLSNPTSSAAENLYRRLKSLLHMLRNHLPLLNVSCVAKSPVTDQLINFTHPTFLVSIFEIFFFRSQYKAAGRRRSEDAGDGVVSLPPQIRAVENVNGRLGCGVGHHVYIPYKHPKFSH